MSNPFWNRASLAAAVVLLPVALTGCKSGPVKTAEAENIDAIVQKSGGDWNRVSAPDKTALIRDLGKGNEQTASLNFQARWNRLNKKGGPPNPADMARRPPGAP